MHFKTSPDQGVKLITWGACGVLTLEALRVLYRLSLDQVDLTYTVLHLLILTSIPFFAWLFSPQGYAVRNGALVVLRPAGSVVIPLEEIESVQVAAPEDISWAVRAFGSGGFFGIYGKFWRTDLGFVTYYLRNRENPIILETTTRGKIVLSPDRPGLVRALAGGA
jgi:hypothetical protein